MVSVIIPSYKHGAFLSACIESIITQSYKDWEIVIVDDGSDDDSVAIAKSYSSERIRIFENPVNLGTYGTLARCCELSRGDFIAVMNSDDVWAPTKLEAQCDMLSRNPHLGFVYCLGWQMSADGQVNTTEDANGDWPSDEEMRITPYLLRDNRVLASSVLFPKKNAKFEKTLRTSGDWVALLRIARTLPVGCIRERLTFWRQHVNNSYYRSQAVTHEEIRVREAILQNSRRWFTDDAPASSVRHGLSWCAINLCALHILADDRWRARVAAIRAMQFGGDRSHSIKRLVTSFMPLKHARARLWPNYPAGYPRPNRAAWTTLDL